MTQDDVSAAMHSLLEAGEVVTFDGIKARLNGGSNRELSRFWKEAKTRMVIADLSPDMLEEIERLTTSPLHLMLSDLGTLAQIHRYLTQVLLPEANRLAGNLSELRDDLARVEAKRDEAARQLTTSEAALGDVQDELRLLFSEVRTD